MYSFIHMYTSVATILLKVYHDNILLSRHVSRYTTISEYCKIGRVRVIRKKYIYIHSLITCSSSNHISQQETFQ